MFVAFRCATLFLGAGFLTGVDAASACASKSLVRDSLAVSRVDFGKIGRRSGVGVDFGWLDLRGFGKGNSRFGGIHILEMSLWSIGVEHGLCVLIIREASALRISLSLSNEKNGEADDSLEVESTRSECSSRSDCIWEI